MTKEIKYDKIEKEQRFWSLVLFIPLAVLILWCLLGAFSVVLGAYPFSDDFESYNLGDLAGQGGWQHFDSDGTYNVVDTFSHTGTKSVQIFQNRIDKIGTSILAGQWSFWIYKGNTAKLEIVLQSDSATYDVGCGLIFLDYNIGKLSIFDMADPYPIVDFGNTPYNDWFKVSIDWDFSTMLYRAKMNNENWSEWKNIYYICENDNGFKGIRLRSEYTANTFIDDIAIEPEARVFGITPESETEITIPSTTFEFGWIGLKDWDSLSVVFQNRATGIFTNAKEFEIETEEGEMEFSLEDFNFDKNGKFNFYATATRYVPEVMSGMYLTGRYSYEWSEDLVSPDYWLMINIGGLEPIFEMSNFTDWYAIKSKFDTPTEMFSSIADFFSPIFSKIGEFGNRIQDYFNVNESYSQGYEIGKAVPYFAYFVGEISLFLGGFPILKWLFIIILLLTGIFIFRLILKFIPFIG
jgi:hypothetical protein